MLLMARPALMEPQGGKIWDGASAAARAWDTLLIMGSLSFICIAIKLGVWEQHVWLRLGRGLL